MSPPVRLRRRPGGPSSSNLGASEALALAIQYRPTSELKPATRNARTHSPKQIQQIAASIRQFGFVSPILLGTDQTVIAAMGALRRPRRSGCEKCRPSAWLI
jgi:hypothetical protein